MTAFLRYVGILNAAVWCGASVFLVIGLPAVFSEEFKTWLGPKGPFAVGYAAELIIARFFILQYCCAAVALAHLALEWILCRKPLFQRNLAILLTLAVLAVAGGGVIQPKLKDLHQKKYFSPGAEARESADKTFKAWHGASECGNMIVIAGLLVYLWRISKAGDQPRYGSLNLNKLRG